jgi:16S rRNA processing protein RimM
MIRKEEVYKIGVFNKPHGVHGELSFTFTDDIFDRVDCDYVVCPIEGILVPFFIKDYRFKSDNTALMTLEGVNDEEKARMFTNVEVFFPFKFVDKNKEEEVSLHYFVGFVAQDLHHGLLGMISEVDDSTANLLFVVEDETGEQYLIPAHEEFITDIDHEKRVITFDLPEGLLTMNHEKRN